MTTPRTGLRRLLPTTGRGRAVAVALVVVVVGLVVTAATLWLPSGTDGPAAGPGASSSGASGDATPGADPLAALTGVQADARDVLTAWARPDLAYDAWWEGLRDRLAPGARTDYAGTDPAALPALTLEAADGVRPGPSEDTKTVFFTTSAGRFGVDMSRRPSSTTWLATRVLFPGQESSLR